MKPKVTLDAEWGERFERERDDARRWAAAWKALAREYWDYQKENLPTVMEQLRKRDELAAQVGALREALEALCNSKAIDHHSVGSVGLWDTAHAALVQDAPAALEALETRIRAEGRKAIINVCLERSERWEVQSGDGELASATTALARATEARAIASIIAEQDVRGAADA